MKRPSSALAVFGLVFALAFGAFAGAANAQEEVSESHLQAARDLVTNAGLTDSFDGMVPRVTNSVAGRFVNRGMPSDMIREVIDDLQPELDLQRRVILNRAARIMANRFTEEEIGEINAFFETPAGAKFVDQQPGFVDDVLTTTGEWTEELVEYVEVRMQAELSRRGAESAAEEETSGATE
ncbi:MAG: hypothetical protein HLUCCO17_05190 [Saliniramus fredricksonii]|uniref:DUF2059 domain-containing protein n=1 Tax=Saliniramus fredricksonii TaxID=1653334 RepID=A0A0P8A9V9_9HYPH|nr:DUF2059 domain-containing protein [Saliniramus fredricksonii]KPQ11877.1 MAG: hypothetical protein HLUCCO17_05190 [Saliniramus fredricksonii]SCC82199.1 hypothetical protein GA0071312_3179 [Saliniramus fredricksonii]